MDRLLWLRSYTINLLSVQETPQMLRSNIYGVVHYYNRWFSGVAGIIL